MVSPKFVLLSLGKVRWHRFIIVDYFVLLRYGLDGAYNLV